MRGGDWIILRTAPRCTLSLARSLAEDGFEAWTPVETKTVTKPRFNVRREVRLPLLAGFVFARSSHLLDLLSLASLPHRPRRGFGGRQPAHESFSVFHAQDRIPAIADVDLEPLRSEETRAIPRRKRKVYARGERVRVPEGSFAGMTGVVEEADGRFAFVSFGGALRFKIASFLLRPDSIGTSQPTVAKAA